MSHITTHILDASRGSPARNIAVSLLSGTDEVIATGRTNDDGRIPDLGPDQLEVGHYKLRFEVADYFQEQGTPTFYPVVTIDFSVLDAAQHYHVPLLISPFAYSTYRGS